MKFKLRATANALHCSNGLTIQSNGFFEIAISHIQIELGCAFFYAQACIAASSMTKLHAVDVIQACRPVQLKQDCLFLLMIADVQHQL